MARYKHVTTGVRVEVADYLVLGAEWVSPDSKPRSESPDGSWKVADLRTYADENGVDLGEATKKDDVLAAISGQSESDSE